MNVNLRCQCGTVQGTVADVRPNKTNRAICYCDDCQAFLHHLGRAEILDAHGGTDVVQVAPSAVRFEAGADRIEAIRLSPKGTFRWYASCCNTPIGNTGKPSLPFIGLVTALLEDPAAFGPPRGKVMGKFAVGGAPEGSTGLPVGMIAHVARLLLGWKLGGKSWPHPFFDRATGEPSRPVRVISREERAALRPLCGPTPTSA